MRRDLNSIYQRELEKVLNETGLRGREAEAEALERAEAIYWDLVDRGRQLAKAGER